MTQIEMARQGTISGEMEHVARREGLEPELVRSEVARGRMIIPANTVHLKLGLEPMGIGIKARCKINANIGNSAVTSDIDNELSKLKMAVDLGSDTVMDLSTGGNIDAIRQAIIAASPCPGRDGADVPGDPAGQEGRRPLGDRHARHDRAPGQARRRLHDDPRRHPARLHPADRPSDHRDRLAGRVADGPVDVRPQPGKPVLHATSTICATSCGSMTSRSAWATACGPGCIADASDAAQFAELKTLGELTRRGRPAAAR